MMAACPFGVPASSATDDAFRWLIGFFRFRHSLGLENKLPFQNISGARGWMA
jgi:hypothetical protein